ncbi:MAG: alpha/beta hydrolase-fold protein [Bacteroidota bacterium]
MKFNHFYFVLIICALTLFQTPLCSQNEAPVNQFPPVILERTEIRTLHSDIIGQDFELWISVPKSYSANDTIVYPVMYLLDPYRAFLIVKGFIDVITFPSAYIPEIIIVGIGYGGEDSEAMINWALGRIRDMTPVRSTETEEIYRNRFEALGIDNVEVHTGGASKFLEFIGKELFPFIGSNYRIDTQTRLLSGYSLGGLFGMYVLFHKPDLFNKYLIGSPSIHFKDGITFDYEDDYARKQSDLVADVFISAGELEESTSRNVKKMEELLSSQNYENLNLKTVIFDNENHITCYPAALSRGIIELLGSQDNN